ncbi:MAG TPA: phosphatase PAP2 family protein [Gemmatimonadaceae bacterium]|nr:phosphatase PAP2 family protein [Gemmatimonadaceae bacterium]
MPLRLTATSQLVSVAVAIVGLAVAAPLPAAPALLQDSSTVHLVWPNFDPDGPSKTLLTRRDGKTALAIVLGAVAVATLDGSVAQMMQSPGVQTSRPLRRTAEMFRAMGEPGALALSVGMYASGRLTGIAGLARTGLEATEAIILAGAATELLKLSLGRARPNAPPWVDDGELERPDADDFRPGKRHNAWASLPSGHTTAAFAAASAITAELHESKPRLARVAGPILYGSAALVGISRMYSNDHWASDVLLGAAVGTFFGRKVVRYHHTRSGNWLEHFLIPSVVAPVPGGLAVGWSVMTK